jgi:hypothetical protein
MKTTLLLISIFLSCISNAQAPSSKQPKIAVFDIDLMVKATPEYAVIDSLILIYSPSELGARDYFEILQTEYKKFDSISLKADKYYGSERIKFLDSINNLKNQIDQSISYYKIKVKEEDSIRRKRLAGPLYEKVKAIADKIISQNKYDIILKPDAIKPGNKFDNMFIMVAKELGLSSLPIELLQIGDTDLNTVLQTNDSLTEEQAVKLAEQFIIDNGYTNLSADKSKLSYELFDEYENHIDSILKQRHNTLQAKAFCISEDKDRWNIGFLSVGVDPSKLDSLQRQADLSGRAVIIMKEEKEIKIAHKAPLFSQFKKL